MIDWDNTDDVAELIAELQRLEPGEWALTREDAIPALQALVDLKRQQRRDEETG